MNRLEQEILDELEKAVKEEAEPKGEAGRRIAGLRSFPKGCHLAHICACFLA